VRCVRVSRVVVPGLAAAAVAIGVGGAALTLRSDGGSGAGPGAGDGAFGPAVGDVAATASNGPTGSTASDGSTTPDGSTAAGATCAAPSAPPTSLSPTRTDLPPVTIPAAASPPTTAAGTEPASVASLDEDEQLPLFGQIVVDLPPGGAEDYAIHLVGDTTLQALSLLDSGVQADIEVFGPDGASVGRWRSGDPGCVDGEEWNAGDPLPTTGTYVVRVVHVSGSDAPFVIGVFGRQ
jgi:hypothetical protein